MQVNNITSAWANVILQFFNNLGLAFISIGLIGIIVNLRDWKNYFQERLAEIIIKKNYLNTLDKSELIDLQTSTLKAFFKVNDIDREGSFLNYFLSKIHGFIGSPYRENVNIVIIASVLKNKKEIIINENISWRCRKVGDQIQGKIKWETLPDEYKKVLSFRLKIQCPHHYVNLCNHKCSFAETCGQPIVFENKKLKEYKIQNGYEFNLSEFKYIDGLFVQIESQYIVDINRFLTIIMADPSNGIKITVRYPNNYNLIVDTFGLEEDEINMINQTGLYTIIYDQWVMPLNGIVYQFKRVTQ
jgi:hypothetical protein